MFYVGGEVADSMVLHDVRFLNNHYVDPDVYDDAHMEDAELYSIGPNDGRLLACGMYFTYLPSALVLDSCIFFGNHQPNMMPDGGTGELRTGGSNVWISTNGDDDPFHLYMRHCRMIDADDGGFWISNVHGNTNIEDLEIIDVGRNGLTCFLANDVGQTHSMLRNIYLRHVFRQEYDGSYPHSQDRHYAMYLGNLEPDQCDVSNVTLMDCDLPVLLRFTGSAPGFAMRSFLLDNNQAEWFYHPLGQQTGFEYSLLPGSFPGVGNMWGLDPGFDSELGAPWLAVDSPLIDAGDPDMAYNDLEDPQQPGMAFWPSLGGLRNDIGYTGGPHAALPDTTWESLPDWELTLQPRAFALGAPYPNPFNPTTQIPYTLLRPAHVRLAVHNLIGQEVAVLVDDVLPAGRHQAQWGTRQLASGLYLVTLEVGGRAETRAVTLFR